MEDHRDFLYLAQHASALSIPLTSVRNAIYRGTWPARTVTLGGRRLVPIAEHQRLVDALNSTGHVDLHGPAALDLSDVGSSVLLHMPEAVRKRPGPKRRTTIVGVGVQS